MNCLEQPLKLIRPTCTKAFLFFVFPLSSHFVVLLDNGSLLSAGNAAPPKPHAKDLYKNWKENDLEFRVFASDVLTTMAANGYIAANGELASNATKLADAGKLFLFEDGRIYTDPQVCTSYHLLGV